MTISIKSDRHNIFIPFPNGLVLNPIAASILSHIKEIPFSASQINKLCRELRKAKKILGSTPMVEVVSQDGEKVIIKL
jgi:hypothetical protein